MGFLRELNSCSPFLCLVYLAFSLGQKMRKNILATSINQVEYQIETNLHKDKFINVKFLLIKGNRDLIKYAGRIHT